MAELVIASPPDRERVESQLRTLRRQHASYVRDTYAGYRFARLSDLLANPEYEPLIDRPLLRRGMQRLSTRLRRYGGARRLPAARTWIGIGARRRIRGLGGFHQEGQGYRHVQQVSILSLVGSLSPAPIDPSLTTLELLRSYCHDTVHFASYRTYQPAAAGADEAFGFHRYQYGINFRRPDGTSYSRNDPPDSISTRNLGIIMEAATDRFAQDLVRSLIPLGNRPAASGIARLVELDVTGEIDESTLDSIAELRASLGEGHEAQDLDAYLTNLEFFYRMVTLRYRKWLEEFPENSRNGLQECILACILSGKLRPLVSMLDRLSSKRRAFVRWFKSPDF